VDRGATDGANASNAYAFDDKVSGPVIASRMKKVGNLSSLRVNSGQVRTLTKITSVARERQVIGVVGAAVLLRHDVLDMMPQSTMDLA
jgi:hypothetical protein